MWAKHEKGQKKGKQRMQPTTRRNGKFRTTVTTMNAGLQRKYIAGVGRGTVSRSSAALQPWTSVRIVMFRISTKNMPYARNLLPSQLLPSWHSTSRQYKALVPRPTAILQRLHVPMPYDVTFATGTWRSSDEIASRRSLGHDTKNTC